MHTPLPSSRQQHRQQAMAARLADLLDRLSDDAVRHGSFSAAEAGMHRRTLAEADRLIGPTRALPAGTVRPADFFIATIARMHALARLNRLQDKGFRARLRPAYPRGSAGE